MKNFFNLCLFVWLFSIGVNSQSFIKDKTFNGTIKDLYNPAIADVGWSSYKAFPTTSPSFTSSIITEPDGNKYYQCITTTASDIFQRALAQYTSQKVTTAKYKLTFRARATAGGSFYLKLSTFSNVSTWLPTNMTDATPGITMSAVTGGNYINITPSGTWQTYSCVFDMSPKADDFLRFFITFDKMGTFELDDVDLSLNSNVPVSSLDIISSPSGLSTITTPKGSLQLLPVVLPSTSTNSKVQWTISDSKIATITDAGLVTAIQDGTVTVSATTLDGSNLTATYSITITGNKLVSKITVTGLNNQNTINTAGGTLQMLADVFPADALDKRVVWSVDMPEYASIDSNGLLTTKTNGTIFVKATAVDLSATVGTQTISITGNAIIPSDQTASVAVNPDITKSIMGHTVFDRGKYINVCHNGSDFEKGINNSTISNRYLNELEMNFGRNLGMVSHAITYTNNLIEDTARPGFANLNYLQTNSKPTNGTTPSAGFSLRFPTTSGTLMHDAHNAYPDFMPKEVWIGSNDSIPVNKVAAGEIVANLLKYNFTDWSRPLSFEPINEPDFTLLNKNYLLPKLADFHVQIHAKVKEIGVPVMVGGPCAATAWYYRNNYADFKSFSDFVDATSGKLDFYSFHVYDFHRWDKINKTLGGFITTGLPLEGIMDMVSAYGWSKYNKELIYLSTEHGGTMAPIDQKADMRSYFLGSATGFAADMKAKSQTDFLMVNSCIANTFVYMNRPHQVFKVVPFILIESFSWDPTYHASILVANNYTDKTKWHESAQVMFYEYFKNVRGRRILSSCASPDIQQQSFVDNNKVIVLLNNLSNNKITMNLNYPTVNLESTMVRRLGRNTDFTPYLTETIVADARGLQLAGKESVAIFLNYRDAVAESTKVDEKLYFATEMNKQFTTESTFNLSVPTITITNTEYAYLRIGVGRGVGTDRNLSVWFNGVQQVVPMEKVAANLENNPSGYGSTKIIQIDKSLLNTANTVKVVFPDNKGGGVGAVTLCVGSRVSSLGLSANEYDEPAVFHPIYPNPVNDIVHFSFTLINPAKTALNIYDLQGKEIAKIASGDFSSGKYEYDFSAENLTSGTYICRLVAGVNEYSQKMIVR